MMMHSFDIYTKLTEICKEFRSDLEIDSEDVIMMKEASGDM
jgi:hypothetical protein